MNGLRVFKLSEPDVTEQYKLKTVQNILDLIVDGHGRNVRHR